MSRITGSEVYGLMEAYNAVYSPQINEDYIWESCLTEEFISEAYQTVADYLVYNGFVPGYNTAEVYMSEMAVEDIDSILFETNVLNEQYLIEAGFFQGLGAGADKFVSGAKKNIQGAASNVQRAGQTAVGSAQRLGTAAVGAVKTDIANKVKAVQGAGQAVVGGAQRAVNAAGGAVNSATRKIGQEVEISRKVGAGEPLGGSPSPTAKSTPSKFAGARDKAFSAAQGIKGSPVVGPKPSTPAPGARPATASPSMAKPATPAATTGNPPLKPPALPPITGKPSLRSGIDDLKKMGTASRQRQGLTQSFDVFDVIKGHLIDEGYADTEESATAIMANMSEEWRQSILDEGFKEIDPEKHGRMNKRYKNLTRAAMRDAQETGEASGVNRFKMGKMSRVIDKSAENLGNRG